MTEIFKSDFVFGLQGNKHQEFIEQIAKPIINEIVESTIYDIIQYDKHLSVKDFENIQNSIVSDLYINFLYDIVKSDNQVFFKPKVCISFDERLCQDTCPNTGRKIATIKVAGVNLAYFILFDVKEFFDFIYNNQLDKNNKKSIYRENSSFKEQMIVKKGYIHNTNQEREFSFARISGDDGIPLYHNRYEILTSLKVGDFVDLVFSSSEKDSRFPNQVLLSDNQNEIENVAKRFQGILTYPKYTKKNFAFINTEEGVEIYVRPSLAEDYYPYEETLVECIATPGEKGWQAEVIKNIDGTI